MTDVLVDMDDVFYPWSATAHALCERAGITNGKKITQWHFWLDYGCDEGDVWEVLTPATISGELYESAPIPDTMRHMRRLRYAGHRVHVVTARGFGPQGDLIQALTREYVRNWAVPLDTLTFVKDKTEVEVDFAVDDGVHNFEALHAAGVRTALMDACHNQHFETEYRVHSLGEFVDRVLCN